MLTLIKKLIPWILGLLYVASPYDAVPDFLVGPGWLDDLAVLLLAYWWYSKMQGGSKAGPFRGSTTNSGPDNRSGQAGQTGNRTASQAQEDPHAILGVEPGASKEEIRAAFKRLAGQYHPDKVQHLGKEFQDLAHQKFVAIQKAYDTLMKSA